MQWSKIRKKENKFDAVAKGRAHCRLRDRTDSDSVDDRETYRRMLAIHRLVLTTLYHRVTS